MLLLAGPLPHPYSGEQFQFGDLEVYISSSILGVSSTVIGLVLVSGVQGKEKEKEGLQVVQHSLFLLTLLLSSMTGARTVFDDDNIAMCPGVVLSVWTVMGRRRDTDTYTGVYKILVFIDSFLNVGQGILAFLTFGLEDCLLAPIVFLTESLRKWRGEKTGWMN